MELRDVDALSFNPGEALIAAGSASNHIFVLLAGSACVEDGADAPPLIVGPGEMVGEIDFLLDQPHRAAVVALERVSALRLTRLQLAAALQATGRPDTANMRDMLAGYARRIAERYGAGSAAAPEQEWSAVILAAETRELSRQVGSERLARRDLPFSVGRKPERRETAPRTAIGLILKDAKPYNLSRRHFAIDTALGGPIIRDAGSQLGTMVNGVRIGAGRPSNTAPLRPGINRVVAGAADSPFRFTVTVTAD